MCGIWKTGDRFSEMTVGQIDRMAKNLKILGVQSVSIGGGEPLVRGDLPRAVESFVRRGMSVRVLTNGVLKDHRPLDRLIDAGCSGFSVSMDSLDAEKMDRLLCSRHTLEKVKSTISYLSPRLRRSGGIGLINTVVSGQNLDELGDILDFAGNAGFYLSLIPVEVQNMGGSQLTDEDSMVPFQMSEEQKERTVAVFRSLIDRKSAGEPVFNSRVFLEKAGRLLSGEKVTWTCLAGRLYFSVGPDGAFSICHRHRGWAGVEGCVTDDDFVDKFQANRDKHEVRKLREDCCECLRPCWAEVAHVFSEPGAFIEMSRIHLNVLWRKIFSRERKSRDRGK